MHHGRLWWASLCLCQLENPSEVQLKTRCYFWTDLSWITSVPLAQLSISPALSTCIREQNWTKSPVQQALCVAKYIPLPLFSTAAGLRFWFLSRKQTLGHIQPWLLYVVKGLLQLLQCARQEAFPWVTAPVVPDQGLAQAQKSHFHCYFQ